jgi:hypothetical protein
LVDSHSAAEWDHRAFLYWPAARLAVIPVETYSFEAKTGVEDYRSGVHGFRVGRGRLAPRGEITHPTDGAYDGWEAQIHRSIVVGDDLLTLSQRGLMVSDLETFDEKSWARFR